MTLTPRSKPLLTLATAALIAACAGCEALDSNSSSGAAQPSAWDDQYREPQGGSGFGGITAEARDIEKRLGIR